MPDTRNSTRPAVKLDFTTGLDRLPPRPRPGADTTLASVAAGEELGFSSRQPQPVLSTEPRLDGRRLRSRGANIQLNLKVTAEEKDMILALAGRSIQDAGSPVSSIGEFVVAAVKFYRNATEKEQTPFSV